MAVFWLRGSKRRVNSGRNEMRNRELVQAEKDLFLGSKRCGDGSVQRVDHRRSEAEVANHEVGELRIKSRFRRQSGREAPLAAPDQVECRMVASGNPSADA